MDNPRTNAVKGIAKPYVCPNCGSSYFRTARLGKTFQSCNCKQCNAYWINFWDENDKNKLDVQVLVSASLAILNYDTPKEEGH